MFFRCKRRLKCGCSSLTGCLPEVEAGPSRPALCGFVKDNGKMYSPPPHHQLHLGDEVQVAEICAAHPNPSAVPESIRQFIATAPNVCPTLARIFFSHSTSSLPPLFITLMFRKSNQITIFVTQYLPIRGHLQRISDFWVGR